MGTLKVLASKSLIKIFTIIAWGQKKTFFQAILVVKSYCIVPFRSIGKVKAFVSGNTIFFTVFKIIHPYGEKHLVQS